MKKFPQWKGIYLAWYSKEFYSDVVLNWRGLALGYLMIVLFVSWLPVAIKLQYEVNKYADEFLFPIVRNIPDLTLKENRLKMKSGDPVTILNPKTKKPIMIFDLGPEPKRPDKNLDGIFFIGNKEIFQYKGKVKEFDLKGDWKNRLVPEEVMKYLENTKIYSGLTFFLTYYCASVDYTLVGVFVFGFIGFICAGFFRRALTFPQTGRIAAMALMPQMFLDIAQRLFSFQIPLWVPFSLVLTLGYLVFGMKSVSVTFNRPTSSPKSEKQLNLEEDVEFSTNKDS